MLLELAKTVEMAGAGGGGGRSVTGSEEMDDAEGGEEFAAQGFAWELYGAAVATSSMGSTSASEFASPVAAATESPEQVFSRGTVVQESWGAWTGSVWNAGTMDANDPIWYQVDQGWDPNDAEGPVPDYEGQRQ
jgi:hypothetical protein